MNREELKIRTYLNIAKELSNLSTCIARKVGCVIVTKDWEFLSAGYNGTLPNKPHCCDINQDMSSEDHYDFQRIHEIHAEINAIDRVRVKEDLKDAKLFCTLSPCITEGCMKAIAKNGIKEVYFSELYHRVPFDSLKEIANMMGVEIYHIQD